MKTIKELTTEERAKLYFVVRDSFDLEKDLTRNWSSLMGGVNDFAHDAFETQEDIIERLKSEGIILEDDEYTIKDKEVLIHSDYHKATYRYHNGVNGWTQVHYEGLGAWNIEDEGELDNYEYETVINAAKKYVEDMNNMLAVTEEAGNGSFYAKDVVAYERIDEDTYVIAIEEIADVMSI